MDIASLQHRFMTCRDGVAQIGQGLGKTGLGGYFYDGPRMATFRPEQ